MIKCNLIANYLSQGWVALMGLAFIPLYIQYLGIEAYGLIGLFAVLQASLTLLDMGMTPTLNREMARFTAGAHTIQSIRDLLRSVEWVTFGIAVFVAVGIWAASSWLVSDWLRVGELPLDVVSQALTIMGVVTAFRLVEGIYRSSLIGLQRQVLFSGINAIMATLRWLGAVVVLVWFSPTIEAFFIWQGLISSLTVGVLACATYRALPEAEHGGRFSLAALRGVRRFAGGMMGITFLALLLTQADKVLLSRLLSLPDFGYYSLAVMVAGVVHVLVAPMTQAWYPKFCELYALNDREGMAASYHMATQMLSVIVGSAAIVVIVFAGTLLQLWTQDSELTMQTATLVSLLTFGNLLNGLTSMPHQAQIAHGWLGLAVRINIVLVLLIVPSILMVAPRYGAEGAAWVWVCLNAGYLLIGTPFMYRKILVGERLGWYLRDLALPLLAATFAALLVRWGTPTPVSPFGQAAQLVLAAISTLALAALAAQSLRKKLWHRLLGYLKSRRVTAA